MYKEFDAYVAALRSGEAPAGRDVEFAFAGDGAGTGGAYTVRVFNDGIAGLLKSSYEAADLERLAAATADLRRISVVKRPWGTFVNAASFESEETAESTNYDAIWVRDSIWGYLALASDPETKDDAKAVLLTQLDYLASQAERIDRAIASPELLDLPEPDGDMNAVHIRFDSGSPDFADVAVDGETQRWTHKQNDAIGLVIDGALIAYADGSVTLDELTAKVGQKEDGSFSSSRLAAIVRLVAYLNAVKYYTMEDSGAWEELPRCNTSSIGIVVSALEKLSALLARGDGEYPAAEAVTRESTGGEERADSGLGRAAGEETDAIDAARAAAFTEEYLRTADSLGLRDKADADALDELIAGGYETIRRQLQLGGESPDYDKTDPHYREADAALLALIYPACPKELSTDEKLKIIDIVGTLVGDYGVRRYANDNYQSGNFWWHDIKTDADPESHKKREESFIPGTEAEWFFDSWYAKCCLIVAGEIEAAAENSAATEPGGADAAATTLSAITAAAATFATDLAAATIAFVLRRKAVQHLNRAFGQITGESMYSADGKPVPAKVPPESYNHIVADDAPADGPTERESWPAPSPIAPLNWAKASLTLMLAEFLSA